MILVFQCYYEAVPWFVFAHGAIYLRTCGVEHIFLDEKWNISLFSGKEVAKIKNEILVRKLNNFL